MELTGKIFDINNENKKVVNTDETFAYFEDGARIKKQLLITKYEEVMDPSSFFDNTAGLSGLAKDFQKIDTNAITENNSPMSNVNVVETPTTQVVNSPQPVEQETVTRIDNTRIGNPPAQDNFFSKIKRNNEIEIDFSITEKFPDIEFVRMMNDNYETSIIDHFANEIVEKLLFDPESLLNAVKNRIHEIVYGEKIETNEVPISNEVEEVIEETIEEETKVEVIENATAEEMIITKEKTVIQPENVNDINEQETNENAEGSSQQGELEHEG